ncbi:hypothetical protein HanRHA438_Chr08g0346431 [Helianthus annuus]|nr:hypothetical protein HanIR_Chr08g0361851 [Helianthus annuus]KAJ0897501.1 hypothetical protein HanRHA438_Chr08g0346431 [Helianthus annuus]
MYSGLSHTKATFVKHGFIPICLINKIRCFKTLIFFQLTVLMKFSAAILFKITTGTTWLVAAPVQGGFGGRDTLSVCSGRHLPQELKNSFVQTLTSQKSSNWKAKSVPNRNPSLF